MTAAGADLVTAAEADQVAAAETLCPILWAWVKDVGGLYNETSTGLIDVAEAEGRRSAWRATFDAMEERNADLLDALAGLADDPILGPLVADVEAGVPAADEELDVMRQLLIDEPEIDEQPRHQVRAAQLAIHLEKVIDVVKPELSAHDADGSLIAAFRTVPSCQQSVKDADSGSTQANG
ncbi:MAG: hypothetical protein R2710_20410 [Acidimicrobiales bacterium]